VEEHTVILLEAQEDLEVVVDIALMQLEIPLLLVHLKVIQVVKGCLTL
tara:strand:- start:276 stop:419 length:144 start_codon:yes stop_codon:yes gene_type:complete